MLDRLFLKHLTKKGVIAYFVGQVIFMAILAYYLFGIAGYSIDRGDEGRDILFIGLIIIVLLWGGICLLLWKKPKTDKNTAYVN
ncbi:hypothetical protein A8C32_12505 [Flavivirga aquatica]|uniref:Uncharacterized protein n=1 Tax=Flavivirga aquatica TaxID=1849968 RepID=A0A1E5TDS3_9FLAO|nr:hypothetical protein [Flavivirga aquatica]OEK09523.1 hypothetical protein A8C32_12505 [Flavivirga aquatica]